MNILIISAHPDDETIGMGGTISKLSKDNNLFWLIISKAFTPKWTKNYINNKKQEIKNVAKFFGFKKTFQADFKTASLSNYLQQEITDKIAFICRNVNANVIYTPPIYDCHLDHEVVTNAVLSVIRPWNGFNIKEIISYEIPVTTNFSDIKNNRQIFNHFVNIQDYIELKLEAMSFYKSELKEFPHPRSLKGLKILSKERGLRSGYQFAEAFSVLYSRID